MTVSLLATQTSQTSGQTSNTMSVNVSAAGTVKVATMIQNGSTALTAGVSSVADSLGNTYTKVTEGNRAGTVWESDFQHDYATAVGTVTLTITYGDTNGNLSFAKAALDDAGNTAGSADISANSQGLSTTPSVSTSPTATSQATETVFTALGEFTGTGLTSWPPTGYTGIGSVQTNTTRGGSMAMAYLAVTSTGVQSATTGTQGSTSKWAMVISTVKDGGGGTNGGVTAPAGVLTLSADVPTITATGNVTAPAGALTLGADAPTVLTGTFVTAPAGALVLSADVPSLTASSTQTAPAGALTLSGDAPTLTTQDRIAPAGVLTLSGPQATLTGGQSVSSADNPDDPWIISYYYR